MTGKTLLDTNVIIDYLSGRDGFAWLSEGLSEAGLQVSVITRMELLSSAKLTPESESRINGFLAIMEILPLDKRVEDVAIAIRRAAGLKLPDAVIAATAQVVGATLMTNDQRLLELK